jgi:hypothetical protein
MSNEIRLVAALFKRSGGRIALRISEFHYKKGEGWRRRKEHGEDLDYFNFLTGYRKGSLRYRGICLLRREIQIPDDKDMQGLQSLIDEAVTKAYQLGQKHERKVARDREAD